MEDKNLSKRTHYFPGEPPQGQTTYRLPAKGQKKKKIISLDL
jgi:hypothetical protein